MRRHAITVLYVLAMVAAVVALVHAMGGTSTGLPHLMYLPITVAAVRAGRAAGMSAAAFSSMTLMLLPSHVSTGLSQTMSTVLVRTAGYLLVAYIVGGMVQRLHAHQKNTEDSFLQSVSALVNMLEVNHKYTAGHSVRVAQISNALATEMGFSGHDQFLVSVGALLHDVGKVGISQEILDKPSRLTPEEFALVKTHPVEGERILAHLQYAGANVIRDIVRHHHERLDGTGYPDALSGASITTPVRIVAVADVYEALISDRPYRAGLSPQAALEIIQEETALGRFDPATVRCLARLLAQHPHFYEVDDGPSILGLKQQPPKGLGVQPVSTK